MPLVGIYFTRALAERRREFVYERIKSWNVNNNLSIVSISKEEVPLHGEVLSINFVFRCIYDPPVGHLEIDGTALYSHEIVKEISKSGKEMISPGDIPKEIMSEVMGSVLSVSLVKATILSDQVNIPPPIPLPPPRRQIRSTGGEVDKYSSGGEMYT